MLRNYCNRMMSPATFAQLNAAIEDHPPHLRGKRILQIVHGHVIGITPAPAGKTPSLKLQENRFRDHPRTCGENSTQYVVTNIQGGSPPHLRGKLHCAFHIRENIRITPAPAGKTIDCYKSTYRFGDHPRTCGENSPLMPSQKLLQGSPPHLRGKLC